jgi:hypothetical protein
MANNQQDPAAARIARQSQMERALEYYTLMGIKPSLEDLVLTSHILHKFIVDGWSKEYGEMLEKLQNHIDKNYTGR